ncbi:serine hydrolase domain-containing protein [Galactobacter valiniphilus]|uniref:serine hydrolase domain-containing protein n=1 Tax=Galactobacter valiniphilus TaxID=2676122 RepID=UPI00373637BE
MQQPIIAPRFEGVARLLADAAEQDPTHRAQLAVYLRGEPVLDLAVGEGLDTGRLHGVFSVSKGLSSLVFAKLVQDGLVDPAAPVAQYWPEFAAAGKGEVTVEQLLSHQAGLPGPVNGLDMDDFLDSRPAAAILAALAPQWTPGAAFGYHALTFGTFIEELVLRITGRRVQELYEEWIRVPAEADAWLGLPEEQEARYVPVPSVGGMGFVDPFGLSGLAMNSIAGFLDANGQRSYDLMQVPNLRRVREVGPAAVGGVASARGLARAYAYATTGLRRADGSLTAPLLSAETIAEVSRDRAFGLDRISGNMKAFGVGFMRPNPNNDWGSAAAFGHDGANGTVSFADPGWGLTFAYLPFTPQDGGTNGCVAQRLTVAVREAILAQLAG